MTTTIEKNEFGEDVRITVTPSGTVIRELISTRLPTRKDGILARLAEIDALGDSPRARREVSLGSTAWVAALDAEAVTLRAELATLP